MSQSNDNNNDNINEYRRLNYEARLRDREEEYQKRIRTMNLLMDAAVKQQQQIDNNNNNDNGKRQKSIGRIGVLVQNPYAYLTQAQMDKIRNIVEEIHVNGYAILENFLSNEKGLYLRQEMDRLFNDGVKNMQRRFNRDTKKGDVTTHIHNAMAKTRALDDIIMEPMILGIIAGVLSPEFQLNTHVLSNPEPFSAPQDLHQDDGQWRPKRPNQPLVCNTLFALDDFTKENGGTWIVPKSQTGMEGIRPDIKQPGVLKYIEMKQGSVAIFDGSMFHAGGSNTTTDQSRRTINLNFLRSYLKTQHNQFIQISRQRILEYPKQLQRLLGYHQAFGIVGMADYQDPLKYLQKIVKHGDGKQYKFGMDYVVDGSKL